MTAYMTLNVSLEHCHVSGSFSSGPDTLEISLLLPLLAAVAPCPIGSPSGCFRHLSTFSGKRKFPILSHISFVSSSFQEDEDVTSLGGPVKPDCCTKVDKQASAVSRPFL